MDTYSTLYGRVLFPLYEQGLRRRNTLRYLRLLEEQQWLSPEELREVQWRKLIALLRHAEQRVPFYRQRMRKAGVNTRRIDSPEDLRRLPVLTKDDIREDGGALVAEGVSPGSLRYSATGGSTGEPLQFKYDHHSYEWRIAGAARADRWAGWDWGQRQFYIWGVSLRPESWLSRLKKRLHYSAMRLKIVSSFDFTDQVLEDYARQLNRYRPSVVVGYTNAIYEFARFCHERGLKVWRPRGVIATAERLYDHQRDMLQEVFRSGVFDRYGSREMMNIAAECDRHKGLHVNADNVYLELLKDGSPARPGEVGEIIVTDLNNYSMPFIRYRIGDMAVAADGPCTCGRGLPLLERIEGRVLDVIVTPDGRYVPGELFPHLLKDYVGIKRFQVYQDRTYAVEVSIVPTERFEPSSLDEIRQVLRTRLGSAAEVSVELVDVIPATRGGKHRVTVSEVKAQYQSAGAGQQQCTSQWWVP